MARESKLHSKWLRKASTIQDGMGKRGTRSLVLLKTFAHENSNSERRQQNSGRRQAEKTEHENMQCKYGALIMGDEERLEVQNSNYGSQ